MRLSATEMLHKNLVLAIYHW